MGPVKVPAPSCTRIPSRPRWSAAAKTAWRSGRSVYAGSRKSKAGPRCPWSVRTHCPGHPVSKNAIAGPFLFAMRGWGESRVNHLRFVPHDARSRVSESGHRHRSQDRRGFVHLTTIGRGQTRPEVQAGGVRRKNTRRSRVSESGMAAARRTAALSFRPGLAGGSSVWTGSDTAGRRSGRRADCGSARNQLLSASTRCSRTKASERRIPSPGLSGGRK